MTIDISDRIAFLKKIHLFRGLDDDQLAVVAAKLDEASYKLDDRVFKQGEKPKVFFLIYTGSVRVVRKEKKIEKQLAVLVPEDYFGEEVLLPVDHRSASVYVQADTLLFVLSRVDLNAILKQFRILKPNFEVAISSRQLAQKMQFTWLQPGEVIYFLARKHPILLLEAMILPILALMIPIGLMVGYLLSKVQLILYAAIGTLLLDIAWIVWRAVDWGNDYYIVTNMRVIWLEKVLLLYDSRQEAPLSTILSVGVETGQIGRILGYGDVIVRTFVGRIAFYHVPHPYQATSLIDEQWIRVKSATRKADIDALKRSIRQKLGLPVSQAVTASASSPAPKVVTNKALKLKVFFDRLNVFKVRFEDKAGTITYRKHWIVLLLRTLLPAAIFFVSLGLIIYRITLLAKIPAGTLSSSGDILLKVLIIVSIGAVLWWIYNIWDWSNDIFQVTLEEIFDIYRKPLGREEKKSAALDNILSTEADRRGLLQIIFNFGNVYISVGKAQMDFFDVYNPTAVQLDIDRRRMARIERKNQADVQAERERMADFFAMYHQTSETFRGDLANQKRNQPPSISTHDQPDDQ